MLRGPRASVRTGRFVYVTIFLSLLCETTHFNEVSSEVDNTRIFFYNITFADLAKMALT